MSNRFAVAVALALTLSTPLAARAATYEIDPAHTSVQFSVRHMMVSKVRGKFANWPCNRELVRYWQSFFSWAHSF